MQQTSRRRVNALYYLIENQIWSKQSVSSLPNKSRILSNTWWSEHFQIYSKNYHSTTFYHNRTFWSNEKQWIQCDKIWKDQIHLCKLRIHFLFFLNFFIESFWDKIITKEGLTQTAHQRQETKRSWQLWTNRWNTTKSKSSNKSLCWTK